MGRQVLEARREGGVWHLVGRIEPDGVGRALGYALKAESWMNGAFYSVRFEKELVVPMQGTKRLSAVVDGALTATVVEDAGARYGYRSPEVQVLDDLSVLYHIRVHPETRTLQFVDFIGLLKGELEHLPARRLVVPAGAFEARGYRFVEGGVRVEAWFSQDAGRFPVYLVYGQGFGTVEARLIEIRR